jgi:hypothetical protein
MSSKKSTCLSNYVRRESYKSKSGKTVNSRCIRKTGLMSGKSSLRTARILRRSAMRASKALKMSKKRGLPIRSRCRSNQTLKSGYMRHSYSGENSKHVKSSLVPPRCITKRGKSKKKHRKSPTLIVLDDHFLSEYGYFDIENKSKEERYNALQNLINHFLPIKGQMATYNYVIRALNARYILNKNTSPKTAKIFKADQKHISKIYKKIKANDKQM